MRPATGTELLDDPAADPVAVRTSLGNIARANRLFGGAAAVVYGLEHLLAEGATRAARRASRSDLTLLDLGTGAGDIPAALRAWGARRGATIRTVGLERLRPAAALAHTTPLPIVLGCVSALPFRTASVDIVTLSQVLHHFDRASAIRVLREAVRVARCGVVVADLVRSRAAATLFGLGAWLLGFDHHTRADGVTSVARGYRPAELADLCHAAGLEACVTPRPAWRLVAWGRPA